MARTSQIHQVKVGKQFAYQFRDDLGENCLLRHSRTKPSAIWFGRSSNKMFLTKKLVVKLIPLLVLFVLTGKLPFDED